MENKQPLFLSQCEIHIKKPLDCSYDEVSDFMGKVIKGGKVTGIGLRNRILNCELIAFCFFNKKLIGISAVKKPSNSYIENVIAKAKLDFRADQLKFEIGYSFTETDFRRNGISKELKKKLLSGMTSQKGLIFATTAIESSKRFLSENGFTAAGNNYDGDNDKGITVYLKEL